MVFEATIKKVTKFLNFDSVNKRTAQYAVLLVIEMVIKFMLWLYNSRLWQKEDNKIISEVAIIVIGELDRLFG
jgi:hypothetical protein